MSESTKNLLLIITDHPGQSLRRAKRRYADDPVSVLSFDPGSRDEPLPERWRRLRVADFLDTDALRRDFLQFLDAWPRQPMVGEKSFDQMFRRPEGYSVWWTGPGMERHPDMGVFPGLKMLWVVDRVMHACTARRVLIYTRDSRLARSLASRCRHGKCPCEFLPGSARPARDHRRGRLPWLGRVLAGLSLFPWLMILRAAFAYVLGRTAPETRQHPETPAVVFASPFAGWARIEPNQDSWALWQQVCDALAGMDAGVRRCYLLTFKGRFRGYRPVLRLYHTAWRLLRNLRGAWPGAERYPCLGAFLRSLPHQLASLLRYYRLEATPRFRSSWMFAGADVSALYVPRLRRALASLSQWAQSVAATAQSLKAIGNVKAMVVSEEMYPAGATYTAAARSLGIPSVGVQHGTIMPMHMIYAIPPGQVEGAPLPDYFAAYGEFAKEIISVHGAYPPRRVWITGGTRFDHLVNDPPQAGAARQRLGLPHDKRVVLVTTQLFPWFPAAARAIFKATKNRKDCLVCLKTHSRDVPVEVYRQICREVGAENVLFFEGQFDDLLAACDVLISASSTTILEAILLDRKTICVNFSDEPERYPYVADGGSLGARSEEQVGAALDRVFSDEFLADWDARRTRFLDRHAGPSAQGHAAETLAGRILALCKRKTVSDSPVQSARTNLRNLHR